MANLDSPCDQAQAGQPGRKFLKCSGSGWNSEVEGYNAKTERRIPCASLLGYRTNLTENRNAIRRPVEGVVRVTSVTVVPAGGQIALVSRHKHHDALAVRNDEVMFLNAHRVAVPFKPMLSTSGSRALTEYGTG